MVPIRRRRVMDDFLLGKQSGALGTSLCDVRSRGPLSRRTPLDIPIQSRRRKRLKCPQLAVSSGFRRRPSSCFPLRIAASPRGYSAVSPQPNTPGRTGVTARLPEQKTKLMFRNHLCNICRLTHSLWVIQFRKEKSTGHRAQQQWLSDFGEYRVIRVTRSE
jgi:hypothetical protein